MTSFTFSAFCTWMFDVQALYSWLWIQWVYLISPLHNTIDLCWSSVIRDRLYFLHYPAVWGAGCRIYYQSTPPDSHTDSCRWGQSCSSSLINKSVNPPHLTARPSSLLWRSCWDPRLCRGTGRCLQECAEGGHSPAGTGFPGGDNEKTRWPFVSAEDE